MEYFKEKSKKISGKIVIKKVNETEFFKKNN